MSSSKFVILCIVLIALFPLHEFVDGQGLKASDASRETCKQLQCDKIDKKLCSCCVSKARTMDRCYQRKEDCMH
ncbi:unnamed protein product [Brassica oleracea]